MNKLYSSGKMTAELWLIVAGFVVLIAGLIGYVLNIITLIGLLGGEITTWFIVRIVGVFIPFLGAVLGYF